jgi:hypothetical protein
MVRAATRFVGRLAAQPLRGVDHRRLPRENFLDQHPVYLLIGVQAQVGQYRDPVVEVGRLSHRREHHAAGRDARYDEMVDVVAAKICARSLPANALTRFLVTTISPLPRSR